MIKRAIAPLALLTGLALTGLVDRPAGATTAGPVTELEASMPTISQRAPAVSFDGTRYAIVWEDARSIGSSGIDLYLARIDAAGALLDPTGIPLLTPAVNGNQTQAQIIYNSIAGTYFVGWTDSRDTDLNIWGTRVIAGSGTVLEPGGFQISSDTAPEQQPSLACAVQSCFFVWQAGIGGGGSELRARRVYPNAVPLDLSPIVLASGATNYSRPKTIAIGSTFFVTWEDDRNTATSGLDLFARTVPELDPFMPVPGINITSAMLRQTEADLAALGPAGIAFVWQDQRNGVIVDDIYARMFDTSLMPVTGDSLISGAAEDQLRPRIAADATRGFVVWQDRRSGAYGFTYGARLDASGALRDGEGFPLLVANANVFEHAIAKGPNADYLVAAVQFTSPARILYRIVRDEPPAGTMTATGMLTVPADGATPAEITFGPARGATPPNYAVVDGTLYTVTLSRMDVTIDVPDRAPMVPGHQVGAVEGQVSFGLTSLAHGPVTVSVASVEGTSTGSVIVTFDNVPPVASDLLITPRAPRSSDDLQLTYTYSDINSDPEGGTTIEWTKNSAIQAAYNNQLTVPASATIRGDQWRARVTPRDGRNFGQFVFSGTVIVGNTAPRALDVRIDPNVSVRTGRELRGRYAFDDDDLDPPGPNTVLRWYDRDMEVVALRNLDTVPGEMVVKGQVWRFEVEPHDTFEPGPTVSSSTVTVLNTGPIAEAGPAGVVIERRRFQLNGTRSSDIDPQDVLGYSWTQLSGPAVALSDTSSAAPSFIAPSVAMTTILTFALVVDDGEISSLSDRTVVEISPVADTDGDDLDDEEEMLAGTDPTRPDTDRDGFGDFGEVQMGSNPIDADTDDDGARDGVEGAACLEGCPGLPGADNDGDNIVAVLDPDADNDGLFDGTELGERTPPEGTDVSKGFFIADADATTTTDPTRPDTDLDLILDGTEDANHNGRVDDGESDPNDPADPPKPCTIGGDDCPVGLECDGMFCRMPLPDDGGLTCRPLADQQIECCSGGCIGGTLVEPECRAQGQLEQCPIGAMQCGKGTCSAMRPDMPASSGCSCSSSARGESSSTAILFLFALALLRVVRRCR